MTDTLPTPPPEGEPIMPTWAPVDLATYLDGTYEPVMPSMFTRTDGVSLVYPGLTHSFHGESESCKSMMAQSEAQRVLAAGGRALYIDFESDAGAVVERLRLLGATDDEIRERFFYVKPESRPDSVHELAAWVGLLRQRFDLAVIDGVTDALAMYGYSTTNNDEVTQWANTLPRRIAENTGAAVIQVDHVTKDSDTRGRFAIGGQAKLAGLTGAAYIVEVAETVGRGMRGVVTMRVAKDRPGYVRSHAGKRKQDGTQEAARIVVDSTNPTGGIQVTVEPWRGADGTEALRPFRPTRIMQHVSEALEDSLVAGAGPLSFRQIDDRVNGKADHIRIALATLITDGLVTVQPGPRNANLHTSVKPYREATDPQSDAYIEAGHTQRPKSSVSVSRLKDDGRDTHTHRVPDTLGTHSGRTQGNDIEPLPDLAPRSDRPGRIRAGMYA